MARYCDGCMRRLNRNNYGGSRGNLYRCSYYCDDCYDALPRGDSDARFLCLFTLVIVAGLVVLKLAESGVIKF